ncbi:MAG TPA: hypothetical protein VFC66_02685 [Anaerolineaceae bacterium]|nr:hypothetical protein [Anaerolineaceae bacterium]
MKSEFRKFTWVMIIVMIGLFGLTAAAIASDIEWPWSTEPGTVIPGPVEKAQRTTSDLQPDDNGYTGPTPEAGEGILMPSAEGQDETVNRDAFIPESAPDQDGMDAEPNWSGLHHYNVAGSALRPRDSSVDWADGGSGGCLYKTSGDESQIFNLHLNIPHGARIDYLTLSYYDTSSRNSTAWITRYDDMGGVENVSIVQSKETAGYGSRGSTFVNHVVDNVNYSYVLNWRPNETGSTMMLCGLRVAYRLP